MRTMTESTGDARILIVGDSPAFGKTVGAILEGEAEKGWRVRHVTYEGFLAGWVGGVSGEAGGAWGGSVE